MGKSKSRIFRKGINDRLLNMTRQDAVSEVVKLLENNSVQKAKDYISMFGLSAFELLEAGAGYECVLSLKNVLK